MPQLSRSVINAAIEQAKATFAQFGIALPPFAFWTPEDWATKGPECDEIRHCMLGWDVTDFGSQRFEQIGRTLFTLRNGTTRHLGYAKTYAEKLLFDPEIQRAPAHFHRSKMEDICCRAGGNMLVQLTAATPDGQPSDQPLTIKVDGVALSVRPGGIVRLRPGMSVNIPPRTIHQFWGEEGTGLTVSSEVSSVCDDWNDNAFLEPAERFPSLIEDAPRVHYLCHEYPAASA
ncbi:MAG: D-lyxose/D-mannose family sugar isomerase [Armatimonadetes bacterium]|nr:D-lyxose/D-mannose family sugar isomerase [Armatimonadota bacterium]